MSMVSGKADRISPRMTENLFTVPPNIFVLKCGCGNVKYANMAQC
jgi:hydroxylamine reductase (hybrid-cluster protein)